MKKLLLAALLGGATACTNSAPAPAEPRPTFSMSRYFYFDSMAQDQGATYSTNALLGEAILSEQTLRLHFQALPDDVHLSIDRSQLASSTNWVAPYGLRCQEFPLAPARVTYAYTQPGQTNTTLILPLHEAPKLSGTVTISKYDAQGQLLSGRYEVRAFNQQDPTQNTVFGAPTCTITLTGTFENLKIK